MIIAWQASLAVFAEMLGRTPMDLSTGRHREDLQPDCRAYTAAIDATHRVGAWTQAEQSSGDQRPNRLVWAHWEVYEPESSTYLP